MRRKAILVVGPPRSGTSVVSHVLSKLGVDFGAPSRFVDPELNTYNPIFFELLSLNKLNDEVFGCFSKKLDDFDWMPERADFDERLVSLFKEKISMFIENEFFDSKIIGLKDTRFCYTLPLWDTILKKMGFHVSYALVRRFSDSVFASNKGINKYSSAANFRLVAQSSLLARHFLEGSHYVTVQYEDLLGNPEATIGDMCKGFNLNPSLMNEAHTVIRNDLNHQKKTSSKSRYTYFKNVIDSNSISPDEHLLYREIYSAAIFDIDRRMAALNQAIEELDNYIGTLNQAIISYQSSRSWRITKPLRIIGHKSKQVKRSLIAYGALFSNLHELIRILLKVRRKGLSSAKHHLELLESHEHIIQVSKDRGLSTEFISALVYVAKQMLRLKRWFLSEGFLAQTLGLLRGKTIEAMRLEHSNIRVHVDDQHLIVKLVNSPYVISGWGVDLETCSAVKVRILVGKTICYPHKKERKDVLQAFASTCELPLETGFSAVITLPVGLHRMRVEADVGNGSWISLSRTLLFWMPRMFQKKFKRRNLSYNNVIHLEQKRLKAELAEIKRHINVMLYKPKFTVIVNTRQGLAGLKNTIQSIREQVYPHCEVRLLADGDAETASFLKDNVKILQDMSLSDVGGDFIIFMKRGQRLAINALYEFASALNQYPSINLIYGDEDSSTASGDWCNPFYKPDWSPDYLETFNYIGFTACFRTTIARGCFDNAHLYDFVLRFTERTSAIMHISKILGHQVGQDALEKTATDNDVDLNITALKGRLNRTGRQGIVSEHTSHKGCYDIQLNIKGSPLVSVIIPTAGKTITMEKRRLNLIENIVRQIRNQSTYKNVEIIVVDNGDLSSAQMKVLTESGCRNITYSDPVFNVPKKLNLGVSIANGELLLLMNDDIEIINPSWIERMIEHFEKPHVGVVGAKLLYPNGETQHVGVVHNFGNPDHVRRLYPKDEAGYFFSTCGVRNYLAVTGACMMTKTSLYREVGGYSEELAISFNDVDYCLKVRSMGMSVVYAPSVELIHMESQSRDAFADDREVEWYHQRWAEVIALDPFYNEHYFTVAPPTFVLCINERLI